MKRIKSFSLFEGSFTEDINEIMSTVKDMLLELSFIGITTSCNYLSGRFISITLSKSSQKDEDGYSKSFEWSDISEVLDYVFSYLESEGWLWSKNGGTKCYDDKPIILTTAESTGLVVKTACEIWFERV